jgi:hypothetical protein
MMQWFYRICISVMEKVYVRMDARLVRGVDIELLGVKIDTDFGSMSRRELCRHADKRFGFEEDALWRLPSTSKIRLACQLARNMRDKK